MLSSQRTCTRYFSAVTFPKSQTDQWPIFTLLFCHRDVEQTVTNCDDLPALPQRWHPIKLSPLKGHDMSHFLPAMTYMWSRKCLQRQPTSQTEGPQMCITFNKRNPHFLACDSHTKESLEIFPLFWVFPGVTNVCGEWFAQSCLLLNMFTPLLNLSLSACRQMLCSKNT